MNMHILKHVLELTKQDFVDHPVWFDFVDDDDMLVAHDTAVNLDEGIYYCRSDFALADGSHVSGYLRIVDREIVAIALWMPQIGFAVYPLLAVVRTPIGLNADVFASALDRTSGQVFPLHYWSNIQGTHLEGWIDMGVAQGIDALAHEM